MDVHPVHLDLQQEHGLRVEWSDGSQSFFEVSFLRKMSPSAETRHLREELAQNPLAVLPSSAIATGPLTAVGAEMVGNYAIRIRFSDGHDTGLYSWAYLRQLDAKLRSTPESPEGTSP